MLAFIVLSSFTCFSTIYFIRQNYTHCCKSIHELDRQQMNTLFLKAYVDWSWVCHFWSSLNTLIDHSAFLHLKNCTPDRRGSQLSMISISMAQISHNCSPASIKYVLTILWLFPLFFKIAHVRIAKVQAIHTANKTLWTFNEQEILLLL